MNDEILKIMKLSNSHEIVKSISENMSGKTFHHHYHILYDIRTLLGPEKKIYTEIGTYCGGSTSLILSHDFNTEINCIDPLHVLPNQRKLLEENIQKFNKNNYKVNIYQQFSTDSKLIDKLKQQNFKTDILFIDGDHSLLGCQSDFLNFRDFVNPGGFIIFDDYLDFKWSPDVKIAVDNIVKSLDTEKYEIIGTLPNLFRAFDNGINLDYLNEFILKKNFNSESLIEDNNTKPIIIMATYYRPNGSTKGYLEKSLESILNQTYKIWDLIIVGDKYEKEEELIDIIKNFQSKTSNKIFYIPNNNVERDNVKDKIKRWHCAGANSMNIGLNFAREKKYKYYCHLDDDDVWLNNHLETIMNTYSNFQNCVFTCNKSKYINNLFLPKTDLPIYKNNLLPKKGEMIHSSFSFRIDILNFLYDTDLINGIDQPSDALMLDKIKDFILKNTEYCSIYSSVLTCEHIEEGKIHL